MNKRIPSDLQPLPSQFRQDDFAFELCQRVDDVALFKKSKQGRDTYEVVIIQHRPARIIFGNEYPAREVMPPSETWGISGWSLTTAERAREKFAEIVRSQECRFSHVRTAVEAFSALASVVTAPTVQKLVPGGTSGAI